MKLYSVRDLMTGFMPPISLPNDGAAIRFFNNHVVKNSDIPKHDLEIWRIGIMDDDNGDLIPETPTKLYAGKDIDEIQDTVRKN